MSVQIGVLSDRERLLYGVSAQLQHKGANPRALFEVMARVIDEYGQDGGPDFARDCHATVGIGLDYLSRILALVDPMERESTAVAFEHEGIRNTVARWAVLAADKAGPVGRPSEATRNLRNTKVTRDTDDSSTAIATLKKRRPDLARQVESGDLTAHAAMVTAGFRARRVAVRTDDPRRAVAVLLRHYSAADLRAALDTVTAGGGEAPAVTA